MSNDNQPASNNPSLFKVAIAEVVTMFMERGMHMAEMIPLLEAEANELRAECARVDAEGREPTEGE